MGKAHTIQHKWGRGEFLIVPLEKFTLRKMNAFHLRALSATILMVVIILEKKEYAINRRISH
jgi:hypothetical protein